jgi:hypothetical protein
MWLLYLPWNPWNSEIVRSSYICAARLLNTSTYLISKRYRQVCDTVPLLLHLVLHFELILLNNYYSKWLKPKADLYLLFRRISGANFQAYGPLHARTMSHIRPWPGGTKAPPRDPILPPLTLNLLKPKKLHLLNRYYL